MCKLIINVKTLYNLSTNNYRRTEYKKQCLQCYINKYTICWNCKIKKQNSYALCFKCNKLDKHELLLNYKQTDFDFKFDNKICELCDEYTFQQQKYCLSCYLHNF